MTDNFETMPPPRRQWIRLLGLTAFVGLVGYGFAQVNQSMRANHLETAPPEALYRDLQNNPKDAELLYQLAYRQLKQGEAKEALSLMQQLVTLQPDSVKAWYGLARCAAAAGSAEDAAEAYRKVVALEPGNSAARLSLSQIYAEAGLVTDALREYDAAQKEKLFEMPSGGDVWAQCLHKKGRSEEAWDILIQSIKRSPKQDGAYLALAQLGIDMKRFEPAEVWLKRRINMTPYPEPDARRAYARLLLAQPDSPQSLETAEVMMRILIERTDPSGETNALLGRVLMAQKRWKEAKQILEQGLKADPEHRDSLAALSEVHTRLGDASRAAQLQARIAALDTEDAALKQSRRAVEAAPEDVNARFTLAEALEKAGQYSEAAEACESILAAAPSDARATALRDACREKAIARLTQQGKLKAGSAQESAGNNP